MTRYLTWACLSFFLAIAGSGLGGCSRSRAEMLRDRSAMVEAKLEAARDRVLADTASGGRELSVSHLQNLRLSLSVVNVSIASVPLLLTGEDERAIGYSVLDEAIGTIDWNIPMYAAPGGGGGAGMARAFPSLFSAETGLDFAAIRRGNGPRGIAR